MHALRSLALVLLALFAAPLTAQAQDAEPCHFLLLRHHVFLGEYDVGASLGICLDAQKETLASLAARLREAQLQKNGGMVDFTPSLVLLQPAIRSGPGELYFGKTAALDGTATLADLRARLATAAAAQDLAPLPEDWQAVHFIDQNLVSYVNQPTDQHWSSPFLALSAAGRQALDLDDDATAGDAE